VGKTFDRITQNPNVLSGRATIRGFRISVAHVVNLVANGMTPAQIVADLRTWTKTTFAKHLPMLRLSPKTSSTRFAPERCASSPMRGSHLSPSTF
jgi:uncharacterized protein (DUF433 family)